ncbi:MAG: T9SS type A sorting domain-containing protein [Ignavibacteriae bacterium]|nr:T9SS type A sorting domain-containing protein [Ignavibacteriota bacterium]
MLHPTTVWRRTVFAVAVLLSLGLLTTRDGRAQTKQEILAREKAEAKPLTAAEKRERALEQSAIHKQIYRTTGNTVTFTRRPGTPIRDNTISYDTLVTPALSNLNYVSVRIDTLYHTYVGDINIRIWGPNGAAAALTLRRGSSGDHFIGTAFTDFAYLPISSVVAADSPFTNFYRPDSTLARFQGASMPAGNWILVLSDSAGGDTGRVVQWSLVVESNEIVPPRIVHTRLADSLLITDRVVQATITDTSGVASGVNGPKLWWRLSTSPTYTSANPDSTSGATYYFKIPGQAAGSVVQYYISAQDLSPTNNSGTLPFGGTALIAPPRPFSYKVGNTLAAGTYTVGVGGFFPTLDSAFARLAVGIKGNITLNLIDTVYSAPDRPRVGGARFVPDVMLENGVQAKQRFDNPDTVGQMTLQGPIFGSGPAARITIRPLAARKVRLIGRGAAVIRLLDASYVTIDGQSISPTGTLSLTISDTATNSAGILLEGNCDFNIISRVFINMPQSKGTAGIYLASSATGAPDDNRIGGTGTTTGNVITSATDGILIIGNATQFPMRNNVAYNAIGSATDSLGELGIYNQQALETQINNNVIQNVRAVGTFNVAGIWVATKHLNTKIWNNVIKNVKVPATSTAAAFAAGMYLFGTSTDITSGNYWNNAIYDLENLSSSATATVRGLYASTGQQDTIAYNTVWIAGTATTAKQSAALWSQTHVGQVWRNNIGINNRVETGTGFAVAFYKGSTASTITSNNNDLYVPTQALSYIGRVGTTNYTTLADWRTQTYDLASVSWNQAFRAGTDLRIDTLVATPVNNIGVMLSGFERDIDNQLRSTTTPDPGVDEFNAPAFNVHDIGVTSLVRTAANDAPLVRSEDIDVPDISDVIELTSGENITFVAMADTARFRAIALNYGSFPETTYQVRFTVDGNTISTLNNTRILAAGGRDTFNLVWNAGTPGAHVARAFTILATEANRANDTSSVNFTISGGQPLPGDTLYSFVIPNQLLLGVAKIPTNKLVFTSGGQSNTLTTDNKWILTSMNGTILDTTKLQIGNTAGQGFGFRDLAWDGRWLLTSDNAALRRVDTTTYTEGRPQITGPGTLQRGVAWEMSNRIWKSNFTSDPVVKFDTTGATVKSLGVPTVAPYGIAFDKWTSANRGYLWYAQPSTTGLYRLSKVDTATGAILTTYDYSTMFTTGGSSGGLDITNSHPNYPGRVVAFMVIQLGVPAGGIVVAIDLGPDSSVAQPTPGWTARTSGTTVLLQSVKQVNQNVIWAAGNGATVRKSVNGGATWTDGNSTPGVITGDIYNIEARDANTAWCTTSPAGTRLYRTTNGGTTWVQVFTDATAAAFLNAIRMYDANNGIATGDPVGGKFMILKTTDGGATWARIATEPTPNPATETGLNNSLSTVGTTHIWFGSSTGPVWRSSDAGATWNRFATTFTGNNLEVHFNNTLNGVTGSNAGVANRTTDGGLTWTAVTVPGTGNLNGISGAGYEFFANRGVTVVRSTDRGATWAVSYTGTVGTLSHLDFFATSPTIGGNFYGTAVSQTGGIATAYFPLVTGVDDKANELPTSFDLAQNYPNPFNPTTTIRYALPEAARVNLSIYNVLGQRVAELTNEIQNAGFYNVIWNGRNEAGAQVATGVYFYRIEATPNGGSPFVSLKKALLLK